MSQPTKDDLVRIVDHLFTALVAQAGQAPLTYREITQEEAQATVRVLMLMRSNFLDAVGDRLDQQTNG